MVVSGASNDVFVQACCSSYYFCAAAALVTLFVLYCTRMWHAVKERVGICNYSSVGVGDRASDILSKEDAKYVKTSTKMFRDTEKRQKNISSYEGHANFVSDFLRQKVIDVDGLMRQNTQKLFLLHREMYVLFATISLCLS